MEYDQCINGIDATFRGRDLIKIVAAVSPPEPWCHPGKKAGYHDNGSHGLNLPHPPRQVQPFNVRQFGVKERPVQSDFLSYDRKQAVIIDPHVYSGRPIGHPLSLGRLSILTRRVLGIIRHNEVVRGPWAA